MKRLFSKIAFGITFIIIGLSATAQTQSVQVKPNQTILTKTIVEGITTMEMMGQEIKATMDAVFNNTIRVDNVSAEAILLQYKIDSFKMAMKVLSNETKIDSEHPDTNNAKEAQMVEALKKLSYHLKISPKGLLLNQEIKNSNLSDELITLLQQVAPETMLATTFLVLPIDSKIGTKWTNTSTKDSVNKTISNYQIIGIDGDYSNVEYSSIIHTKISQKINGMDAVMTMDTNSKGEILVNMKTGIVKITKYTTDGDGTMEIMGQSVPMIASTKGSTVTSL